MFQSILQSKKKKLDKLEIEAEILKQKIDFLKKRKRKVRDHHIYTLGAIVAGAFPELADVDLTEDEIIECLNKRLI